MKEYQANVKNTFKHDKKKFKKEKKLSALIEEACEQILSNPEIGEAYLGNLVPFFKYKLEYNDSEFRIIYTFYACCDQKQQETKKCRFETENLPSEGTEVNAFDMSTCAGLVSFVWVKTREECNNFYSKAKFDKSLIQDQLLE